MVAELNRDEWRTKGCTNRCGRYFVRLPGRTYAGWLEAHDASDHEAHGRRELARKYAPLGLETVETGPLVVDGDSVRVMVDGRPIALTPTELAVVAYLARNLGRVVGRVELLQAVWGPEYGVSLRDGRNRQYCADAHLLRVTMARVRAKLGPARPLVVTVTGVGYRLERV